MEYGFQTSEKILEITKALLEIQNDFIMIKKSARGKNNDYTPYEELVQHAKPILSQAQIILMQPLVCVGEPPVNAVLTRLQHISGEFIESVTIVKDNQVISKEGKATQSNAVAEGGGFTYTKRYALAAIFAWATGEKDIDSGDIKEADNKVIAARGKLIDLVHAKCKDPELSERIINDVESITRFEKLRLLYKPLNEAVFTSSSPTKAWQEFLGGIA